jgi:hypothetical protein
VAVGHQQRERNQSKISAVPPSPGLATQPYSAAEIDGKKQRFQDIEFRQLLLRARNFRS